MSDTQNLSYTVHILHELKRLSKDTDEIKSHLTKINSDINLLKFKASLWGALAGAIPVVLTLAIMLASKLI